MTPPPHRRRGSASENRTTREDRPDDRPARKTKRGADDLSLRGVFWMIMFLVAVTLGAIFFVVPIMVEDDRDATTLQARGVAATARAVRIIEHPGSARSAPTYKLVFAFRIAARPAAITDEAYITAHEANTVPIPSAVPIVYDPLHPSLAALNLADKVQRRHPLTETIGWMAILFVILAAAWAGQIALLVSTLQQRRARIGR